MGVWGLFWRFLNAEEILCCVGSGGYAGNWIACLRFKVAAKMHRDWWLVQHRTGSCLKGIPQRPCLCGSTEADTVP